MAGSVNLSLSERLKAHFVYREGGCWVWVGAKQANGYGRMTYLRKSDYAHRWAYLAFCGPDIPAGKDICHTCDNRLCVNPEHLFLGSRTDNMRDAKSKGRLSTGERHARTMAGARAGAAVLTWKEIKAIRALASQGIRSKPLAEAFGVSSDNINRIIRKDTWKEEHER